jgi:hypothetical protein
MQLSYQSGSGSPGLRLVQRTNSRLRGPLFTQDLAFTGFGIARGVKRDVTSSAASTLRIGQLSERRGANLESLRYDERVGVRAPSPRPATRPR